MADGSIRVKHREFITNISTLSGISNPLALPVNPADTVTFPWLSHTASNYERWKPISVSVMYEPFTSATTDGSVSLFMDYDPNDSPPINKAEVLNAMGAVRCPIWSNIRMPLSKKEFSSDNHLFVRTATRAASSSNLRFTDAGTIFAVVTDAGVTEDRDVGEIWIEYEIELKVPSLSQNEVSSALTTLNNPSSNNPLGDGGSDDSNAGSSNRFLCGQGIPGADIGSGAGEGSILQFAEDFAGQVEVSLTAGPQSIEPPSLMVLGTELGDLRPALMSAATGYQDTTAHKYKALFNVVATAGQALRVITDVITSPWDSGGSAILKMLPYAKVLMGTLLNLETQLGNDIAALQMCRYDENLQLTDNEWKSLASLARSGQYTRLPSTQFNVARVRKWLHP